MSLVGNEVLFVNGVQANGQLGATLEQTTTGAIAALGGGPGISAAIADTAISTTGATGTLTAAALVGGQISRTGPTQAFTDTTATAAQIVAALPEFVSGGTFFVRIKNLTSFEQTINAGSGVTWSTTKIIGPYSVGNFFGTIGGTSASPTVVFSHMVSPAVAAAPNVVAPATSALNTVYAGTAIVITAANMLQGYVVRGGAQTEAFTDITDSAANIIAANPALISHVGTSFTFFYQNATTGANAFPATVTAGSGVTVSGVSVVPAGATVQYLVTYTAAATLTVVGELVVQNSANSISLAGTSSGQVTVTAGTTPAETTLTLPNSTDTLAGIGSTQTLTNKTITDAIQNGNTQVTTGFTTTSSTVLANVIGLAAAVSNSGVYNFRAHLNGTAGASGGIRVSYSGPTLAGMNATTFNWNGTTLNAVTNIASTTSAFTAQAAAYTDLFIDGCFTVGASGAGTFQLQATQSTSSTTATTVVVNSSYLEVWRVS